MIKIKRIASMIMCAVLAMTFTACQDSGKKDNFKNAPDYLSESGEFNLWAYSATCDDWYMLNGNTYYFEQGTMQTAEHTKWYKECGFNVLFIDWTFSEDPLQGDYDFESSELKRVMDLAYAEGLKCFIFNPNLHALSKTKESLINVAKADGKNYFASFESLVAYTENVLAAVKEHPAFYGISLVDEASYLQFDAISEVYQAVKTVCPDAYVMINSLCCQDLTLLKSMYCEGGLDMSYTEGYNLFLEDYYNKIGNKTGYFMYDDYPILEDGILPTFIMNNQIVSEYCSKYGLERRMVLQTTKYANRRAVTENDMWWQINIAAAMGTKDFSYYTYYPTVNTNGALPDETAFIVNRTGERNQLYYDLQKIHKELQFMAKPLLHFEYVDMNYYVKQPLSNGMSFISGLEKGKLKYVSDVSFEMKLQTGGVVLITELYDKQKDRTGYYVVNITEPSYESEAVVTLTLDGFLNAQVYQFSTASNVKLSDGKIILNLGTGRGAFVIPFN